MSNFVGFRLNVERDADIIKDLERYKDTTGRMKEVYRRAMRAEDELFVPFIKAQETIVEERSRTLPPKKAEKIVWKFPKEPSVSLSATGAPTSLKSAILSNDF